jgi:hypothetical protein
MTPETGPAALRAAAAGTSRPAPAASGAITGPSSSLIATVHTHNVTLWRYSE